MPHQAYLRAAGQSGAMGGQGGNVLQMLANLLNSPELGYLDHMQQLNSLAGGRRDAYAASQFNAPRPPVQFNGGMNELPAGPPAVVNQPAGPLFAPTPDPVGYPAAPAYVNPLIGYNPMNPGGNPNYLPAQPMQRPVGSGQGPLQAGQVRPQAPSALQYGAVEQNNPMYRPVFPGFQAAQPQSVRGFNMY